MKVLLSAVAVAAITISAGPAFAMCGHQSAKIEQSVASAIVLPAEQEAVTTHEAVAEEAIVAQGKAQ